MQSPDSTASALPIEKAPEDLTPLWKSGVDSDGRRTLAFRRSDTGEPMTSTEYWERNTENIVMRRHVRRMDQAMC